MPKVKLLEVAAAVSDAFLLKARKFTAAVVKDAVACGLEFVAARDRAVSTFYVKHGEFAFHLQNAIASETVVNLATELGVKWGGNMASAGNTFVAALLGAKKPSDARIRPALEIIRRGAQRWAKENKKKLASAKRGQTAALVGAVGPSISMAVKNADGKWVNQVIREGKLGDADIGDEVLNALLGALTDGQIEQLYQMARKRAMIAANERKQALSAAK